jgi:hypothetical protein
VYEDESESINTRSTNEYPKARLPQYANRAVSAVLRSNGQPLQTSARAPLEARFGHDFSSVRLHADAAAAESAKELHAAAYTVGNHVVFGSGQYRPQSASGQRILAHELAHVVQQARGGPAPGIERRSALEADADRAVERGEPVREASGVGIACKPLETAPQAAGAEPGYAQIAFDAVIHKIVAQLPGQGLGNRLVESAARGFISELANLNPADLKSKLAELLVPGNAEDFVLGYTPGAVAGLVSPVTDVLALGGLIDRLPEIVSLKTPGSNGRNWRKKQRSWPAHSRL